MRIDLKRGLLRAWVVIAIAWIGVMTWWWVDNAIEAAAFRWDCWDQLKWPNGTSIAPWELREGKDFPNDDYWRKYGGGITLASEREQWLAAARQKLKDCEAVPPSLRQQVSSFRRQVSLKVVAGFLAAALGPPIALLIAGYVIGWIARGFRVRA
jgi:hypothetical protein